jgi:tetratricopeptide (TPR) repeat protein
MHCKRVHFRTWAESKSSISMKSRLRYGILIAVTMLFVSGMAALIIRRALGPTPSLSEVRALARARQFNRAQALLARYLRAHPQNTGARLLMAQITTEPTNLHPEIALDHLGIIQPDTSKQAASAKFFKGKARYQQGRYDLAEACWKEALDLDPTVPEAGWALFNLLDLESRAEEAHRLGMRMHDVEPDPRDRVRILLELSRIDNENVAPGSQVLIFETFVKQHPESLPLALALGLALVHDSRGDEGVEVLKNALRRYPDSPEAWDAWLRGLADSFQPEKLAEEFARMPKALATDSRFAKYDGMIAEGARDWPAAIRAYRRAFAFEPYNGVVGYRFCFVLRQGGDRAELERIDRTYRAYQEAFKQIRAVYDEALSDQTLGLEPHAELYQRLADLREKMGRSDEARAWHRLVVRDSPDNAVSLAALARLK